MRKIPLYFLLFALAVIAYAQNADSLNKFFIGDGSRIYDAGGIKYYTDNQKSTFATNVIDWVNKSGGLVATNKIAAGFASISDLNGATNGLVSSSITNGLSSLDYVNDATNSVTSYVGDNFLASSTTNEIVNFATRNLLGDWTVGSSLTVETLIATTITNTSAVSTNFVMAGTGNAGGFGLTNLLAGTGPLDAVNLTQLQGATNGIVTSGTTVIVTNVCLGNAGGDEVQADGAWHNLASITFPHTNGTVIITGYARPKSKDGTTIGHAFTRLLRVRQDGTTTNLLGQVGGTDGGGANDAGGTIVRTLILAETNTFIIGGLVNKSSAQVIWGGPYLDYNEAPAGAKSTGDTNSTGLIIQLFK